MNFNCKNYKSTLVSENKIIVNYKAMELCTLILQIKYIGEYYE